MLAVMCRDPESRAREQGAVTEAHREWITRLKLARLIEVLYRGSVGPKAVEWGGGGGWVSEFCTGLRMTRRDLWQPADMDMDVVEV